MPGWAEAVPNPIALASMASDTTMPNVVARRLMTHPEREWREGEGSGLASPAGSRDDKLRLILRRRPIRHKHLSHRRRDFERESSHEDPIGSTIPARSHRGGVRPARPNIEQAQLRLSAANDRHVPG